MKGMQTEGVEFSEHGVRVLHILAKSFPELNGYSVRGYELIKSQKESGLANPVVLTSPFYPDTDSMSEEITAGGVRYLRSMPIKESEVGTLKMKILNLRGSRVVNSKNLALPSNRKIPAYRKALSRMCRILSYPFRITFAAIDERIRMGYLRERIIEVVREYDTDIVHAHTPFKVGLPAMQAAIESDKKFVYEVRGLWEESAVARGKFSRFGFRFWRFRMMENKVLKGAEVVFCISEGVKRELIGRGIDEGKITVIHNAAPKSFLSFAKEDADPIIDEMIMESISELENIRSRRKIIGYAGNVQEYEGIETLVDSVREMVSEGEEVHLAIVSNEDDTRGVSNYCEEAGIGNYCTVIGPVPREAIPRIYRCFYVNVIPRLIQSKMARLVTPLKPLEALALGVPLIISDSPAIREIVSEDMVTFFDSGSSADLKKKIKFLMSNEGLRSSKVETGRKWVAQEATWDHRARDTVEEYLKIIDTISSN